MARSSRNWPHTDWRISSMEYDNPLHSYIPTIFSREIICNGIVEDVIEKMISSSSRFEASLRWFKHADAPGPTVSSMMIGIQVRQPGSALPVIKRLVLHKVHEANLQGLVLPRVALSALISSCSDFVGTSAGGLRHAVGDSRRAFFLSQTIYQLHQTSGAKKMPWHHLMILCARFFQFWILMRGTIGDPWDPSI